jgi:hypothetical protein
VYRSPSYGSVVYGFPKSYCFINNAHYSVAYVVELFFVRVVTTPFKTKVKPQQLISNGNFVG